MVDISIKRVVILCTIVGLIAGCQTPTHERVFLRHPEPREGMAKKVPFNGQYRLYTNPPRFPTVQNATPIMEARLSKGDMLGFALGESGKLMVVVGAEQKPMVNSAATAFTWTMQPDPGQFDSERTILLVVTVVLVAGITVGIIGVATNPWH